MKHVVRLKTEGGATLVSIDLAKSGTRFRWSGTGLENIDTISIKPKRKGVFGYATFCDKEIPEFSVTERNITPAANITFRPGDLTFAFIPG